MTEMTPRPPAGRSVRLFLTDGSPHGLIVADVGNWNGKVLSGPRGRIAELLKRPEARRTGVYVQIGPDLTQNGPMAYWPISARPTTSLPGCELISCDRGASSTA